MTQTFDCPKCGAPLSFEPKPGDETVDCPYCHETVIIPEELRVPLPRATSYQPMPQYMPPVRSRSRTRLVVFFIALALLICGAVFVLVSNSNNNTTDTTYTGLGDGSSTSISSVGSATATIAAKATNDALQPVLQQEQAWPVRFTETFNDNKNKWDTGDVRDSYITGNQTISNSKYTWNITSVQSSFDFSSPNTADLTDFYASVDMDLQKMPDDPDADAGLIFRSNTNDQTWYYFSVNDVGQYYFGWFDGSDWYTLIPETDSTAIHPGESNRLTVGVQGSQFIFLINGQMVDHFVDDNLASGVIGLAVNLPQTGEQATVEFANFSVLAPSQN